jgi:hypothetical protein
MNHQPTAPDNRDAYDYPERIRGKSITCISSPFTKPDQPPAPPLLSRVLRLRLLNFGDFPLQHPLRHQPLCRVRIHAPHVNRIHAHIQNVPTA